MLKPTLDIGIETQIMTGSEAKPRNKRGYKLEKQAKQMSVELELNKLKARVEQLETTVRQLVAEKNQDAPFPESSEPQDLLVWLKTQGWLADLPPTATRRAERWRSMPEAEQRAHIRSMRQLRLETPLSQIVQEHRR